MLIIIRKLFKYYISKIRGGGGVKGHAYHAYKGGGWGVKNLTKHAYVILECSLKGQCHHDQLV